MARSFRSRWRGLFSAAWTATCAALGCAVSACAGAPDAGGDRPIVIRTIPGNGESGVDSALGVLTVTFSEAMGDGWSWVTETGHAAPEVRGLAFYIDEVTNVLPVKLAPQTDYAIWVNSPDHQELRRFANPDGVSARAARIQFETR
jgi:hypothetical protein